MGMGYFLVASLAVPSVEWLCDTDAYAYTDTYTDAYTDTYYSLKFHKCTACKLYWNIRVHPVMCHIIHNSIG
jgi:hypothetical protein